MMLKSAASYHDTAADMGRQQAERVLEICKNYGPDKIRAYFEVFTYRYKKNGGIYINRLLAAASTSNNFDSPVHLCLT